MRDDGEACPACGRSTWREVACAGYCGARGWVRECGHGEGLDVRRVDAEVGVYACHACRATIAAQNAAIEDHPDGRDARGDVARAVLRAYQALPTLRRAALETAALARSRGDDRPWRELSAADHALADVAVYVWVCAAKRRAAGDDQARESAPPLRTLVYCASRGDAPRIADDDAYAAAADPLAAYLDIDSIRRAAAEREG